MFTAPVVPSEPALYKPMMVILWLLPVIALTAAVFVLVARDQVGRKLSWLMAALVGLTSVISVITLIATWGDVGPQLQGTSGKIFWILVLSVAGVTVVAITGLLLDRRLTAAAHSPDKPLLEENWRAALIGGGLLTMLPQAILPFLAMDSSGALMGGLAVFLYVVFYDVLVVAAIGATVYRLAHAGSGVSVKATKAGVTSAGAEISVKAATWTRVAAISVGWLGALLQIIVVVILWGLELSHTPTTFLS